MTCLGKQLKLKIQFNSKIVLSNLPHVENMRNRYARVVPLIKRVNHFDVHHVDVP